MTDRSNVITVSIEDLQWINERVPGNSKRERLVNLLKFYKENSSVNADVLFTNMQISRSTLKSLVATAGDMSASSKVNTYTPSDAIAILIGYYNEGQKRAGRS